MYAEEKKDIIITFPSGYKYKVPIFPVAETIARYYTERAVEDSDRSYDEIFEDELQRALKDDYVVQDWVKNNMNWEDIEDEAELVEEDPFDPSENFSNARISVEE